MTLQEIITQLDHDLSFQADHDATNDIIEAIQDIDTKEAYIAAKQEERV